MTVIPTLRTMRLVLRPMVEADFPAYRDMMGSPRSTYMGGPVEPRFAWGMFCHDIACWTLYGHGGLMIELAETGECVGQVGVNGGPMFPEKELGWLIYEGFEGSGYATEAAAALRDWAFATLGIESLVSYIDPANAASLAVAERLEARPDENAPRQDPEDLVFRHRRDG
jgi:RimJ/RimL family protein N-acetyltransferase